jgi:predicted MFS family arabinose efflux permease
MLSFLGNFYAPLYSLYAIRILGLTPAALGLTIAMGGIGSLFGAFLAQRSLRRFGLGHTLIGSLLVMSVFSLLTPLAHGSLWLATGFLSVAQIFGDCLRTIYFINQISLRQAVTPDYLLGRTNASIELISAGTQPVGALVGGLLGGLVGIRPTLVLAALGGAAAGLWLLSSPVRHVNTIENIPSNIAQE